MKEEGNEDLVKRVMDGQATPEERRQLAGTDPVKRIMQRQWDSGSDKTMDAKTDQRIWTHIATRCGLQKKRPVRREMRVWYAACAVALLLIGSYWFMRESKNGGDRTEYHNVVARKAQVLTLPDHTKIWMQPGTSIRYAQTFNENRRVWLKGDATFEVTKHAGHPFRVYMNDAFIEVKGTTFHVNNRRDNVSRIALYSGRVDFHTASDGKAIEMKPNQRLTYRSNGRITVDAFSNIEWMHGIYKFSDMRLDSLISTVNSIYDVNLTLAANVPPGILFTGAIRYDERLEDIIGKICYVTDLKCTEDNEKITIYKHQERKSYPKSN